MQIKVKLFATFREGREREQFVELGSEGCPRDVFEKLRIQEADVAILLINGMNGKFDQKLNDGDTLSIFPPVGGG